MSIENITCTCGRKYVIGKYVGPESDSLKVFWCHYCGKRTCISCRTQRFGATLCSNDCAQKYKEVFESIGRDPESSTRPL
jgi:hypothetical protein